MISVNKRASKLVHQLVEDSEALEINILRCKNGATIIDAGVEAAGSFEAGLLVAEISMGGLGRAQLTRLSYEDPSGGSFWLPAISVHVSHPTIACLGSQIAAWPVRTEKFSALGSGPACALYGERGFSEIADYKDHSDVAILLLECHNLPDENLAAFVADKCGVSTKNLTLIVAPAASLVGAIQIAARVVETGMHKLMILGFDVHKVKAATGFGPLATISGDELESMGRSNDAILYGGQVFFTISADDKELSDLVDRVPSMVSKDYGTPFTEILKRYEGDFYQMDPLLFSPAQVIFNNPGSGNVFSAGRVNHVLLRTSLLKG